QRQPAHRGRAAGETLLRPGDIPPLLRPDRAALDRLRRPLPGSCLTRGAISGGGGGGGMSVDNSEFQEPSDSPDIVPPASPEAPEDGPSVIRLIQSLQRSEVTGKSLSATDRRKVVEHLTNEGYVVGEIAEVLKISD